MKRLAAMFAFVLAILAASNASAQFEFRLFETDEMLIVYMDEDNEYVLPHLTNCFTNSFSFHKQLFDYTPSEQVTVLLQDFDDYGYAGASAMPTNYLTIGIEPFEYVYETSPTNERINWVMSHELLHIIASDKPAPTDQRWRNIFGGKVAPIPEQPLSMLYSYLTTPRMYAPRWYHEGLAVFFETWMAGGFGRALGGYDEMVFRTMVHDDAYFYDTVGLESEGKAIDFQVGQVSYLYGTRFVSFLADQYGPETLVQWLDRSPESKASYRGQFEQVYGKKLDDEWRSWIEWEHTWQRKNLDEIREYPVTEFEELSDRPLGSVSRAYFDPERRKLITAVNYPGEFAHIAAIDVDTWEAEKIAEVATPALYYVSSVAYDPESHTVFFTTDNSRQWRDINAVDLDGGKTRVLGKNIRTGDLAFNRADRSLWGVQHHNGLSTLVRFAHPYRGWDDLFEILTLPYGKDIFDIDISPDGAYLTASMIEVNGRQRLIRMKIDDLLAGDSGYQVLYEFAENSPANFVHSPDGRYLYGTSYYTGVSNIFRFDFESGEMEAITNALTGFFRPLPISNDQLIAFHYTTKGFIPVMLNPEPIEDVNPIRFLGQEIVNKHPVVKEWMLPPPAAVDLEALAPKSGLYKPLRRLRLSSWYPIVENYRGQAGFGARLNFMDPVGFAAVDLTASVTPQSEVPSDETFHFRGTLRTWPWTLNAYYNPASFYDFFGPTEESRKGYGLVAQYDGILINDRPRSLDWGASLAGFGGLDTLPEYQEIEATINSYFAVNAWLEYKKVRKTIGGLNPEKGVLWGVYLNNKYAESENFLRARGKFDLGISLPIKYSSLWLRSSAGYSWGDPENTLSNFYFGAFGNNWVDYQEVRRYHEYYSFPGLEINQLGASNFGKLVVEWELPAVRFKRAGIPALYCTWASPSLFGSAIVTDLNDSEFRREIFNFGAQIDFKLVIFTNLSTTFSVGYARAIESGQPSFDEFMISLKIL
ncbi:MAG: hypothetical protein P8127_00110 [Acidobacteriota bacterium]